MFDFAIAAHAMRFAELSATIQSIDETYPEAKILVGIDRHQAGTADYVAELHPAVQPVEPPIPGMAAVRSTLVERAHSRFVVFIPPGCVLGDDASTLAEQLTLMADIGASLGYAAVRRPVARGSKGRYEPVFQVMSERAGRIEYRSVATPREQVASALPADLGADTFVVDSRQIGPDGRVDWDARFAAGFENRDLAMAVTRDPELRACHLPGMRVDRLQPPPAEDPVEYESMLACYLRKWGIHTEQFGPTDLRRHVTAGRYGGFGARIDLRRRTGAIVRSKWRDPRGLAQALARITADAKFNRYVVSKNADMLVDNIFIGRDGSWLFVAAGHCESDVVLSWLTRMETGLPPRDDIAWMYPDRSELLRPREIGLERTAELLESPTTFKFTFVRDPFDRAVSVFSDLFSAERATHPPAEALRNAAVARDQPVEDEPSFELSDFLAAVATQPRHERDRHWRPLTDSTAWGRVSYDFVGKVETMSDDLGAIAAALDRVTGRTAASDALEHVLPHRQRVSVSVDAVAADIIRKTYRDDFVNFGYATEPDLATSADR